MVDYRVLEFVDNEHYCYDRDEEDYRQSTQTVLHHVSLRQPNLISLALNRGWSINPSITEPLRL